MTQTLSEPISVQLVYSHKTNNSVPRHFLWKNQTYSVSKVGLHHTYRDGRNLFHVFSVVSNNSFFRLQLNTESLFWTLEEISDGLSS